MNYADIKKVDIANGTGVRVSLFVSGCTHHCKGCFNEEAWDFNYGTKYDEKAEQKIMNELNHSYVSGLTLLGGEPLEQANQKELVPLVKKVKEKFPEKSIWCYTGYTFEKDILENMYKNWETTPELLKYIDVLVDGEFEEENKKVGLRFKGSTNQRILDVKESLKNQKAIPFALDK